jgi:hypothetical protein
LISNLFDQYFDIKNILNIFQQVDSFYSFDNELSSFDEKFQYDFQILEEQKKQDIRNLFYQTSKLEMISSLYFVNFPKFQNTQEMRGQSMNYLLNPPFVQDTNFNSFSNSDKLSLENYILRLE